MLRQVYIYRLYRKRELLYFRKFGKAVKKENFDAVLDDLEDEAFGRNPNEIATYDYFKYRISYLSDKSLKLLFLFVTGLTDKAENIEKELRKCKKEFLSFFDEVIREGTYDNDTFEVFDPTVDGIHKNLRPKISLCGFSGVGKTTITRLIKAEEIPMKHIPTITGDIATIKIGKLHFYLWDFAGQEQFSYLWTNFIKGSDAVLLITDSTLENVEKSKFFLELINEQAPNAHSSVIANKQDLDDALPPEEIEDILGLKAYSMVAIDKDNRDKMIKIIADILEMDATVSPLLKPLLERDKKIAKAKNALNNNQFQEAAELFEQISDLCLELGDDSVSSEFYKKAKLIRAKIEKAKKKAAREEEKKEEKKEEEKVEEVEEKEITKPKIKELPTEPPVKSPKEAIKTSTEGTTDVPSETTPESINEPSIKEVSGTVGKKPPKRPPKPIAKKPPEVTSNASSENPLESPPEKLPGTPPPGTKSPSSKPKMESVPEEPQERIDKKKPKEADIEKPEEPLEEPPKTSKDKEIEEPTEEKKDKIKEKTIKYIRKATSIYDTISMDKIKARTGINLTDLEILLEDMIFNGELNAKIQDDKVIFKKEEAVPSKPAKKEVEIGSREEAKEKIEASEEEPISIQLNPEDFMVKKRPKKVSTVPKEAKSKLKTSSFGQVYNPDATNKQVKQSISKEKTEEVKKVEEKEPLPKAGHKMEDISASSSKGGAEAQQMDLQENLTDLQIQKAKISKMILDLDMKELSGEISAEELEQKKARLEQMKERLMNQIAELKELISD